MAKIDKKKFFEIEIPIVNEKFEAQANSLEEINNKTIKLDLTRQLRGKTVEAVFTISVKEGKATAYPKKLTLLSSFIRHMLHTGIDYVEDSFIAESQDSQVIIKPFLITRKKVSKAVRRALRNSAKNWLIDYAKTKNDDELFSEILSNQLQKPLSLKLKKIYPLAICEIRRFEIKKALGKKTEENKEMKKAEEKNEEKKNEKENKVEEVIEEKETEEKKSKKIKAKKESK